MFIDFGFFILTGIKWNYFKTTDQSPKPKNCYQETSQHIIFNIHGPDVLINFLDIVSLKLYSIVSFIA